MIKSLLLAFICLLPFHLFSQPFHPELQALFDERLQPFYFGVASGDPLPDGVVIWTKIALQTAEPQQVEWQVATDTALQNVVQSGTVRTDTASAFTVKIDVKNLQPGTTYFYRFKHQSVFSPIGRTKTAVSGDARLLRLAVVSCSDFQSGFYNAYEHIARRNDLDAVVHLGDYIYEYGPWRSSRRRMKRSSLRLHLPAKELVVLKDYRTRYGQYRLDPQLMECHRLHPFIVIWDDHETANNANATGASNHDPGDGDWEKRKATARQAYFEWLPIRDNPERSIIRQFSFGNLAELWMLDERLEARSPQVKDFDDPAVRSPDRYMLGEEQTKWLLDGMAASKARWKIIGNQVIFSPLNDSKVFTRKPDIRMDRWDGYPVERQRIFDFWYQNQLRNIVVLTGDVHSAWALELTDDPWNPLKYDRKTGKGVIGAEFVTTSITSINFDEVIPRFLTWEAKRRFCKKKNNPHLRYLDIVRHGYLEVTFTPEKVTSAWYFLDKKEVGKLKAKVKGERYLLFDGQQIRKGK
ncbi:MAG: alkaline phosphatase D family protein [Bacteroidota bacterium]|mgnify:CR=1 FL=1